METQKNYFKKLSPIAQELYTAAIAANAQSAFLSTIELTLGSEMVKRYQKTETANYGRFEPLIKVYLTHYVQQDVEKASAAGLALLDLARSIWSADA